MSSSQSFVVVMVPREGVNDDAVRIVEWRVGEGQPVEKGQSIATLETAKCAFEFDATRAGFLFPLAAAGAKVPVGEPLALIAEEPRRPDFRHEGPAPAPGAPSTERLVTKKAQALIDRHGLAPEDYAGIPVVRASDIEQILRARDAAPAVRAARIFRGEPLDEGEDWDAVLRLPRYAELRELLTSLRRRMKARYNRHVSTGDLLYDRWDLARDYGFGEGTSVYDSSLIIGDVRVGKNCWVGPNTYLDGSQAPLQLGDFVDVGTGTQIYTHNTIERALTGHKASLFVNPTTIGNCCFLGPMSIIAPGTVLGDHCSLRPAATSRGPSPRTATSPGRRPVASVLSNSRATAPGSSGWNCRPRAQALP